MLIDIYWCTDMLVGMLNRHVGWLSLMHWCVGLCAGLTCWLMFTDALTCWLVCWIDMLVDYHGCIDVLVGMLNRHVGWLSLMHWRVGWYVELTYLLTITDALMYWLVCWINMLVDYHWCIDMLVGVLNRHAVCTVLLNVIVADQLLHLVIKRSKKKNFMFITYSKLVENLHSAVVVRWNLKQSII